MKTLAFSVVLFLLAGTAVAKEATANIRVTGMTCGACAAGVKWTLQQTKGVKSATVSLEKKQATVVYEDTQVTEEQLREAINTKTGFKAEPAEKKEKK